MSTTLAVARARLRSMLREPTANQWTDARLNQLLQDSDWEYYKKAARNRNSGYGELEEDVTLAANTETFSLTPGSNPTALTKNLKGIVGIDVLSSAGVYIPCEEMQEETEFLYRTQNATVAAGGTPRYYRLRRPNILFLPVAAVADTLRIRYRPRPTAFASDSDTLDLDDDYVPMIVQRAAVFALADLGESETQFDATLGGLEDEFYADLAHMSGEGRTLRIKSTAGAFD